jgi:pyruvate carboxylase
MPELTSLLIANRGEIAVRIARAAIDLGIRSVAVYAEDDAASLHPVVADEAVLIPGRGAAAYLDMASLIAVARDRGCDAVHPGYGFLSENAAFAQACADAGLIFVGPDPEALSLFGDKARARALAQELEVPVIEGTGILDTAEEAEAFFDSLGAGAGMAIKAVAGGGGRGMRLVTDRARVAAEFKRCASEAARNFGSGAVYAERMIGTARHVEVQVVGDGTGTVSHLHERECSLQRRHQKLIEIAPAPGLDAGLREALCAAALKMAARCRYRGLGTFEFLVDAEAYRSGGGFAFIEANPRLQVEHTVTEMVTGVDLVQAQLAIAGGATLADLGLAGPPAPPRGTAVQARINLESLGPGGVPRPTSGTLTAYDVPSGPGLRTDTFAYAGYRTSQSYDPLLAKVIAHAPGGFRQAARRLVRALEEFRIEGVETNRDTLRALLCDEAVLRGDYSTRFIESGAAAGPGAGRVVRHHG